MKNRKQTFKHNQETESLVRFQKISWDTDGRRNHGLPSCVEMGVNKDFSHDDICLNGADLLSDKFGYCVEGFEFEILE